MEGIGVKQDYQELLRRYIDICWRRRIWIVVPFFIGIVVAVGLLFYLPKIYRSTTLILVEAQKVPEEYVKSAVTGTVEGRLSTIQQQILSRSLLQRIIDRFGLYLNEEGEKTTSLEENIDRMRKNIEVKTVGSRNVDAFSISFSGKDPKTVMNVTSELASLFIEENLKIREQLVEGTTEFLDNELKGLKETLERQEDKIGELKRNHMGELPEQLQANLHALDRFHGDLAATQLAKKLALERREGLEKTFQATKQNMDELALLLAEETEMMEEEIVSGAPSDSASISAAASPLRAKLIQRKKDLADLMAEYKENYPDVIMLKREISEIEEQIAAESDTGDERTPSRPAAPKVSNRPAVVFEKEPAALAELQKQLQASKVELKRLEEREQELLAQIRSYERRVDNIPMREQEFSTLLRDYENTKKNYQVLLDKKLNAKISENLEKRQKGEQFRVLDPANLPEKPVKPNPRLIIFAGMILGLAGGVGLAFLREQLDNSVRTPEELEKATSIPVLASIPDFNEEVGRREEGRRRVAAVAGEKSSGENDGV